VNEKENFRAMFTLSLSRTKFTLQTYSVLNPIVDTSKSKKYTSV
jgi:hypothetical protein